jgi:hypothetical protein
MAAIREARSLCGRPTKRPDRTSCCAEVESRIDRPDPATYSQGEQFAAGLQPTWNSPDIVTNLVGAGALLPEARVTIRNRSSTASAIGVAVHAAVSRFGIGFPRSEIGASVVTLTPGQQQTILIPFPQAVMTGEQRIGFHVHLEHASDPVLINNDGSQIIDAFATSAQGRNISTSFRVRNPQNVPQSISLQLLATPPGIQVAFNMPGGVFGPFEERTCTAKIAVESWLVGGGGTTHEREVTFVARGADGRVIDGLTFYILVNS